MLDAPIQCYLLFLNSIDLWSLKQCQRKLASSAVLVLVYWPAYWGPEVPFLRKGYMLQLALLGGDESCFLSIFLSFGEQCLDFCSKLASAVRTARTASQPSLCHQNSRRWRPAAFLQVQTELHWVGCILDSEQNSKQINLNTSGIYSLSRLTVPNYFKWVFSWGLHLTNYLPLIGFFPCTKMRPKKTEKMHLQ